MGKSGNTLFLNRLLGWAGDLPSPSLFHLIFLTARKHEALGKNKIFLGEF
jgi:hypothetical protein